MDNFDHDFWEALDKLVQTSEIAIDRPKGFPHPKHPDFLYPVDYGYLKSTASVDGEGIDVWVGTEANVLSAIICTVDLLKRDSEVKLLLGCTEDETAAIWAFHNQTPFMKGILVRR